MPFVFDAEKFQAEQESRALSLARSDLSAFAHRGLDIINAIIRVKTGRLRLSVAGNFATGHNGGSFIPPPATVQLPVPAGLSIDSAVAEWFPGDGLSTRSLLKYAFLIEQDKTFEIAEAMLAAEAA